MFMAEPLCISIVLDIVVFAPSILEVKYTSLQTSVMLSYVVIDFIISSIKSLYFIISSSNRILILGPFVELNRNVS